MPHNKQIFQAKNAIRKNVFTWTSRVFLYCALLLIPIIIIAVYKKNPNLPRLNEQVNSSKNTIVNKEKNDNTIDKEKYAGISNYLGKNKSAADTANAKKMNAAFYVSWDAASLPSLAKHIDQLNMVIPDWFFIDPIGDTLITKIDDTALQLMQQYPVKIVPLLSNLHSNQTDEFWDNKLLARVLNNPSKRSRLIADIATKINAYHFAGINIDFEDWDNNTKSNLIVFQKQLYDTLHAMHKIVSQDILPLQENDVAISLEKYNDYLFVMAYNQHWSSSDAGDICEQRWIEKVVEEALDKIPSNKLVLCLAGFGYDWQENAEGTPLKYAEALSLALNHKAIIEFDNDTYNSHFEYTDDDGNYHEAYFFDAAGMFNIMRMSHEMGLAGTALWRISSEDERLWNFYNRNLSTEALIKNPFDFNTLKQVAYTENTPAYIGNGEVLDVQSYPQNGEFSIQIDTQGYLISEQNYSKLPTQYVIKKWGNVHNQVVLTFDDGPDEKFTPKILDILEKENVPATFFITGANAQDNLPLLQRIDKDGFEIGNHTFSHPNISTVSGARAELELKSTRLLIEAVTGKSTVLFRAPYNADSEPTTVAEIIPIALSKKANYYTIGESIDPRDWEENVSADSIVARTIAQYESNPDKGIILLHDAGGDRQATIIALPKIIKYFRDRHIAITTIGTILGKSKEEIMPTVNKHFASISGALAIFIFAIKKIFEFLFGLAFILGLLRIITILSLAFLQRRQSKKEERILANHTHQPPVSIIVPAYNESITIQKTIDNLLQQNYAHFNIIFIDDGSTDDTYDIALKLYQHNPLVQIFTKANQGKASALNYGICKCNNEFVVCIDADTILLPDAIAQMMHYFINEKIGAVAGNVKVGNKNNMLTNWQSIEYITAQNIDRRAFDLINGIAIVPGAIGAFRKQAIIEAGGFASDTLAEDCDLTIRINKNGYTIRNCNTAIAMTEAPETITGLLKQRFRWNYGVMQSFWKNKHACFNIKYKGLGMLGLPNILLFQIVLPLLSPIADLFFIFSMFWSNTQMQSNHHVAIGYVVLLLIDIVFSGIAFYFEGEHFRKLFYVIPQRIFYKPLMYIVIFKSVIKAIKGETQNWGSIARTGNVQSV
jgi:peptidoglycan-N-acetylglucosamine deacetylase